MGFSPQVPMDILYTLHQCKHCGSWLNKQGYVNLNRNPKIKTSKGVYCEFCRTAPMRAEMDKENAKILKKSQC